MSGVCLLKKCVRSLLKAVVIIFVVDHKEAPNKQEKKNNFESKSAKYPDSEVSELI